ncbi:PaaX family transcriptional regulator C-terminal domain-containing protein [Spongisporangium articulatum]|uniref:PaaX family transcriptional regulator C-terminal domain-containing protein n=1 Tax=Spongisporangium articulatum TaxID=3362603 RepID=A0ABW8AWA9_9ACTN
MASALGLKPLSARSVVISLLLGAHPRGMSARQVVRAGEHFSVPEPSVRVALTRAVASGDLVREGSTYRVGARLLERGERQAQQAAQVPWTGDWEMAVVITPGRPSTERAALRQALARARLGELREGVWLRPANLDRPVPRPDDSLRTFTAAPVEDPAALAATLWDLAAWAAEAEATLERLAGDAPPDQRLATAAHLVRHLTSDPLLPPELCPTGWPGPRARQAYAGFQEEVRRVVGA